MRQTSDGSLPDKVRAGDFIVDIEKVQTCDLIKMRKLLPRDVYRTVKNRKFARIFRQKNKSKRNKLHGHFERLQNANNKLKRAIERAEQKLHDFKSAGTTSQTSENNPREQVLLENGNQLITEVKPRAQSMFQLPHNSITLPFEDESRE